MINPDERSFQKESLYDKMRVILTGGGTGGHVNPALAIADIIKQNYPNSEIIFIGTKKGIENSLVGKEGYKVYHVEARGFSRSLSPKNLISAWYYLTAPSKAKKIIKKFAPDIVIGTGGYVCYAPLKAAASLGIPTMVHESNAYPGLAVKMLQKSVNRILLNFAESEKYIDEKDKISVVGNPVRSGFGKYNLESARKALGISDEYKAVLLSYGGSLGAPSINDAALEIMQEYTVHHPEVLHIHATGRGRYAEFEKRFTDLDLGKYPNIQISDYVYDMPKKLAAADLVISRAGAMTVTEMARMGKPCIMIPSAHVVDNHQYKNAKVLADANAVVLVTEKELIDGRISREVSSLLESESRRNKMSVNIKRFAGEDASRLILKEINELLKK